MAKFATGDVVILVSGSMKMAVESVEGSAVNCIWADGGNIHREALPEAVLDKYIAPERVQLRNRQTADAAAVIAVGDRGPGGFDKPQAEFRRQARAETRWLWRQARWRLRRQSPAAGMAAPARITATSRAVPPRQRLRSRRECLASKNALLNWPARTAPPSSALRWPATRITTPRSTSCAGCRRPVSTSSRSACPSPTRWRTDPAIQLAGQRAIAGGQTLQKTLDLVAAFRKQDDETPVVLMGYYNPIYNRGVEDFLKPPQRRRASTG